MCAVARFYLESQKDYNLIFVLLEKIRKNLGLKELRNSEKIQSLIALFLKNVSDKVFSEEVEIHILEIIKKWEIKYEVFKGLGGCFQKKMELVIMSRDITIIQRMISCVRYAIENKYQCIFKNSILEKIHESL